MRHLRPGTKVRILKGPLMFRILTFKHVHAGYLYAMDPCGLYDANEFEVIPSRGQITGQHFRTPLPRPDNWYEELKCAYLDARNNEDQSV